MNSIFTLGLVVGLSVQDPTLRTTVGNLGWEEVAFPKPVFSSDTIRVESGEAWLVNPDFARFARLCRSVRNRFRGMWTAIVADDDDGVTLERIGPGEVCRWDDATA